MSNSADSLQTLNSQARAEQAIQPPTAKTRQAQAAMKSPAPEDKVTISEQAKQALTNGTKPANGGDGQ